MPKPGFKSVTMSDTVYDRLNRTYEKCKDDLAMRGIRSLSGYCSSMLDESLTRDATFAMYPPVLKVLMIEDGRIVIRDAKINRIIEIDISSEIRCLYCESTSCMHVGFALALPETYNKMGLQ